VLHGCQNNREFGSLIKKLGKDKNGAVMRAARKYDLWMGESSLW
jgi:hypothetical protein